MEFESAQNNTTTKLPILKLAQENGTSVTKMLVPVTIEEKTNKKNDVKARSLPPEWNTHVVVWMNKADIKTMSIDDFTSSTNDVNTANPAYEVSTVSLNINTACPKVSTTNFSDNVVYAFMVENPNGSNLLQQDLEKIHKDGLEVMDLKWQLSLLSMRAKRYSRGTGKKIFINANDTAGYDKSKVECFNCHKTGHFARECRAPRNKEGQFKYQDNTRKQGNNEDTSSKAMLAIDGVGFDWSDMAEEQVQTNMALMAFSDSEVYNDKTCTKTCLKNYETLKKQCDDLIVKLNQTEFTTATYKRGLATIEEQLITYRKNEVLFSEEVAVLKREVACKDYEINVLKNKLLGSQITNKSKKGLGYNDVPPPHPLIYNLPKKLDLSYSGLDEFKEHKFKSYGSKDSKQESNIVYDKKSYASKENSDDSLVKEQVSEDTSSFIGSSLNADKETVFLVDKKVEFVKPKNHEKPVKKSVRTHPNAQRNMVPRAVLMKTGLKLLNTVRTVNTAHPKSTAKAVNTPRPKTVNTARPHSAVVNAVRVNQENVVKASACWGKPQQDDIGFIDSGCSRHMTGNIAYLSDFKEFDRGYVGDEAIHKELGDRMERAATTASSLEAEQDSVADEATFISVDVDIGGAATIDIGLDAGQGSGTIHKTPTRLHNSPLPRVHTLGSDEGSLQQNKLMDLVTKLTDRVKVLENDMQQTKKVYSSALTKLILRVKKLEKKVKTNKARRRARIVISEDEDAEEDSSKQGRKISEIDKDPTISLVQPEQDMEYDFDVSTAEGFTTAMYTRRSAEKRKDKGKAIMKEAESVQKKSKKQLEQEGIGHEEAIRFYKKNLIEEDEQEVVAEADQAHDIDWSDPVVLRYHALQKRYFSVAEVRKNMCMYLKNQGGYKLSHFKGMSYKDIRPIFERSSKKRSREDSVKDNATKQKLEDDAEKKDLRDSVYVVPRDDVAIDVESLATKYLIVDWKTHVLIENMMYYQIIRADGSSKNYKIFSEMLDDFDRQDVLDLHRLVQQRYDTTSLEGYDLLLWGDLKIIFEPNEEDEI
ncbi:putative ribonuclease H-like domain-containing protein [Tanacetum coccineum]